WQCDSGVRSWPLDADDMHVRQRLLAEMRAHDAPYGLSGGLLDLIVIPALCRTEVGDGLLEPRHDGFGQAAIGILDTTQADDGVGFRPALLVDHHGSTRRAIP